jgi:hypothetical protein
MERQTGIDLLLDQIDELAMKTFCAQPSTAPDSATPAGSPSALVTPS